MKHIYTLTFILAITPLCFGQDTLKTEIVFTSRAVAPIKVYKISKENFIYYGGSNAYTFDANERRYYPSTGISYEKEYLLNMPGSALIPDNKEVSFVIVDETAGTGTKFTTITTGGRQVWDFVPAGKNYKTGKGLLLAGFAGLLTSGVMYFVAAHQQSDYKMKLDHYNFQVKTNQSYNSSYQVIAGSNPGFFQSQPLSMPQPPANKSIGYALPTVVASVSLSSIIAGFSTVRKNSPGIKRIE